MNTILLATDGSPSAAGATAFAIELAADLRAPLHAVAVWHTPVYTNAYYPVTAPAELIDLQRTSAHQAVERVVEAAAEADVAATFEVREGVAADEICSAASERDASMIVIGAHGWGAVKRLVFGSVSHAVLHDARCAVLVVRGEHATPVLAAVGEHEERASS